MPQVEKLILRAKSGNGAVPTGAYTLLVPENWKRRWFAIKVPLTEADDLLVVLANGQPGVVPYGQIQLSPGDSAVFSMSGDMPFQGAIYATGTTADSYCYWTEAEDYP